MNKQQRVILKFFIGMIVLMLGASLSARINLGIATYDSFILNSSIALNITYGTFNVIIGFVLVLIQFVFLKRIKLRSFSQMLMLLLSSACYDLFYYVIFGNLTVASFYIKILLFLIADVFMALGIAIMTTVEFESFPMETLMKMVNEKFKINMGLVKYIFDGVWLVLSLVTCFIFQMSDTHIGWGTLFLLVTQGMLIGFFHGKVKNILC